MDQFILLGDSLFQRAFSQDKDDTGQVIGSFGPRLSDAYVRRLDIVNRGYSGYNTRQVISVFRIPASPSLKPNVRFVVIFLGANDARLPNTPGGPQQHVPLAEFKKNLDAIVSAASHSRHVILVTPPPVDERKTIAADSEKDPALAGVVRRKAMVTRRYAHAVCKLGKDIKVPVLDLWSTMIASASEDEPIARRVLEADSLNGDYIDQNEKSVEGDDDLTTKPWTETSLPGSSQAVPNKTLQSYLHDGLHLSRKGYDLLFDGLMALISSEFPNQTPERLPMAMPAWDAEGKWNEYGGLVGPAPGPLQTWR